MKWGQRPIPARVSRRPLGKTGKPKVGNKAKPDGFQRQGICRPADPPRLEALTRRLSRMTQSFVHPADVL